MDMLLFAVIYSYCIHAYFRVNNEYRTSRMHAGSGAACLCECLNENIFGLNFPE